jgi:mRNA interferase RelE/StbE
VALRVRLLDAAARDLARLDKPEGRRVVKRIDWLASNPDTIRLEALSGSLAGFYRLRVGDIRVIYEILDAEQILIVHAIGHRREIYRKR